MLENTKLRVRGDNIPPVPETKPTAAEAAAFREKFREERAEEYFREREKAVIVPAGPDFELLTIDPSLCGVSRFPIVAWRVLENSAPEPVAVNCWVDGSWPAYNLASFAGEVDRDRTAIRDPSGRVHIVSTGGSFASAEAWFESEIEIANEHAPVPMFHQEIGKRGHLTPANAKEMGDRWRQHMKQYGPKAQYVISIGGYADNCDVAKIPRVREYVRLWAKHAGMDDVDVALKTIGPRSPIAKLMHDVPAFVLLVRCGVFGPGPKEKPER
jgi:hypothetical protein